jgi:flagellar motility protein MotE (MotC chaperone)
VDQRATVSQRLGDDGRAGHGGQQAAFDQEIILEKDQTIQQLKETIEILELKVKKLEQLVKLKDDKIRSISQKMQTAGIL